MMMKRLVYVWPLMVLLCLCLGCKDEVKAPFVEETKTLRLAEPINKEQHKENPYDYVGAEHNRLLELSWQHIQETGDESYEGKRQYILDYMKKNKGIDFAEQFEMLAQRRNEIKDYRAYISKSKLSDQGKEFVLKMYDTIDKMADPVVFENDMLQIEERIIKADLPDKERNGLLVMGAVGRHSGLFWSSKSQLLSEGKANSRRTIFGDIIRVIAPSHVDFISAVAGIICGDSINDIIHYAWSDSTLMGYYLANL